MREVDVPEPGGGARRCRRGHDHRGRRTGDGSQRGRVSSCAERHIGIVFQFFNLLERMTVLENVALPAVIAGRKRRQAETRARDLLDLLGIGDKASARCQACSPVASANGSPSPAPGQRADAAAGRRAHGRPGLRGRAGGHRAAEPPPPGGQTIMLVTHDPGWPRRPSASCACGTADRRRPPARGR